MLPVEAAARATLGAFIAGGAAGQTAEEIVRDLDARSLARVLARRCRQRVRRALPGKSASGRNSTDRQRCFAGMSQRNWQLGCER